MCEETWIFTLCTNADMVGEIVKRFRLWDACSIPAQVIHDTGEILSPPPFLTTTN